MPKYAYVTNGLPPIVQGFYDTDAINYPTLPDKSQLIELSDADWGRRMDSHNWTITNGTLVEAPVVTPVLTIAQQALQALSAGVQVVSTSAPNMNGTYACDEASQHKIMATSMYIAINNRFPGPNSATLPWLDMNKNPHIFQGTGQFQAFATAIADYVAALDQAAAGASDALPAQPVMIP